MRSWRWSPLAWSASWLACSASACFMSGTPKSSSSKSGKCATSSSRFGSSNFSIPCGWWSRSRPRRWSCTPADGSRGSVIARDPVVRHTWRERGEWGRRGGVISGSRRLACWRNYDAIWEVTCPGTRGTRRARRCAGPPPPPTDRARSRSSSAREPFRARRSPSGAIVALARPRVASRTTSTLTPKPEPVGETFAFKKRASTGRRTCCGLSTIHPSRRARRERRGRARLLARRVPDRVDGRRRQWTRAWTRARGVRQNENG